MYADALETEARLVIDAFAVSHLVFARWQVTPWAFESGDRPPHHLGGVDIEGSIEKLIVQPEFAGPVGIAIDDLFARARISHFNQQPCFFIEVQPTIFPYQAAVALTNVVVGNGGYSPAFVQAQSEYRLIPPF
ncbi:hypothetical protein BTM36_21865 [Herbaspirillum sp. VT-16-41]|nr:hypothetical protein BTM36_21865 [Herbaspirillum sp. VT-16-41]